MISAKQRHEYFKINKNKKSKIKLCLAALSAIAVMSSSVFAASAATDRQEINVGGNNLISTSTANRTVAYISSMAGSNTGSVQGTHTMTYRSQETRSSTMSVKTVTKTFGGTGGDIMKNNQYLVDYASGKHTYNISGFGSYTANTKAYY